MNAPATHEGSFTFQLTQHQEDVRDWAHGFAERVVRPAAREWDEREEMPWTGHSGGREDRASQLRLPGALRGGRVGADGPDPRRGAVLGRAGIAMATMGSGLAVSAARGSPSARVGTRRCEPRLGLAVQGAAH